MYSFPVQAQDITTADIRQQALEIQRAIESAQALARQIAATEDYMRRLAAAKRAITVNAPDPKKAEEIREIAARALLTDPVAARAVLDVSAPTTLSRPITITLRDDKSCWTGGQTAVLANGQRVCGITVSVMPHTGKNTTYEEAYQYMLSNCLLHEVMGHGVGQMRCGEAYNNMPRWVKEGTSVLNDSAETQARRYRELQKLLAKDGKLPFPTEALGGIAEYPDNKSEFYSESMALSAMLVNRLTERFGPEKQKGDYVTLVLYFGLVTKEQGMRAALAQYYEKLGIKNVAELELLLRTWIEEK